MYLCIIFVIILVHLKYCNCEDNTVLKLISQYNYPVEEHYIETSDGYILKAQRIPHGVDNTTSTEVILLAHGMGGSGENFVVLPPPDGLGYYLADRRFDVWLFNHRGTLHSRKHKTLNPDKNRKKFWNFSWHEIAVIDLPDTINYVLKVTGKKQIFYAAHSQGTTILFAMLAEHPEMNEKIKVAALMAPSLFLQYITTPILIMGARLRVLGQTITNMLNWYELPMANGAIMNRFLKALCSRPSMKDICLDAIYIIGGSNSGLINKTILPTLIEFTPSSLSTKQAWHYAQVISSGEFKQYDYGKKINVKQYNSTKPPFYDLSNIKVPIGLFYGESDYFCNERMIEELVKTLPNIKLVYKVPVKNFNHLDYVIAYNVIDALYDKMYNDLFSNYLDVNIKKS